MFLNNYKFKKASVVLLLSLFCVLMNAQQKPKSAFKRLSSAEKCWVVFHLFKAKRAYRVSKDVQKTVDSLAQTNTLGKHITGSQLDAFKHAYWMYSVADEIGWRSARTLGKAHEKGNYQWYKKHRLEDGVLPDKPSSEMDLFNNAVGISYYRKYKKADLSNRQVIQLLIQAVKRGEMRVLLKDNRKEFVDCNGNPLLPSAYHQKWENDKCLLKSDLVF